MRKDIFELYLVGSDGVHFEERQVNGAYYVCALPGTDYQVGVKIHRDADGQFPAVIGYRIVLRIDGVAVRQSLADFRLHWGGDLVQAVFRGFACDLPDSYETFVFSAPQIVTSKSSSEAESTRGVICVSFYEVEEGEIVQERRTLTPVKVAPTPLKVIEDKKFWQQPSLETSRGTRVVLSPCRTQPNVGPHRVWKNLRSNPDAQLTLNYHMPDVLNFIGEHVGAFTSNTSHAPVNSPSAVANQTSPVPWKSITARAPDTPRTPIIVDLTMDSDDDEKTVVEEGHKLTKARLCDAQNVTRKRKTTCAAVMDDIISL